MGKHWVWWFKGEWSVSDDEEHVGTVACFLRAISDAVVPEEAGDVQWQVYRDKQWVHSAVCVSAMDVAEYKAWELAQEEGRDEV